MMGILAGNNFDATLVGDDSIAKRPMKRVTDPLRLMGCNIEGKDDANYTPIKIYGGNLKCNRLSYASCICTSKISFNTCKPLC